MIKTKKKAVVGPRFDAATNLFQLKVNRIILESDSKSNFYLRKNELQRINEKILPLDIRFIIQDETMNFLPELVNVKTIMERIDVCEFRIQFEESSEAERWTSVAAMNEYFDYRVAHLSSRQSAVFDLVIQTHYNDQQCFLIQYSVQIADICNAQILKLIRKATDAVHNSSEEINNSNFIYIL